VATGNAEHIAILKESQKAWELWRRANRHIDPDLGDAQLRNANLTGLDFMRANMSGAMLVGADLRNAFLDQARLDGARCNDAKFRAAKLANASLRGVDFSGADFRVASLRSADFRGSRLSEAVFYSTALDGADFTECSFGRTLICNVDLRRVQGLEAVHHHAPSSIGMDTILLSRGEIPESFLRGCGLPDSVIAYARSLAQTAIEFYSCFISYSHADEDLAKRLYADLQAAGVRCWFSPEDMKIGDKFRQRIDESIRLYDKLLVLLSVDSVRSQWVESEVESAFEIERRRSTPVLFPIRLDDGVMTSEAAWASEIRRTRHIGDFQDWKNQDGYARAFDRLRRDLRQEGSKR
jgi:uncharacterized protein YjbI with pentapeptide repeats